MCSVLVSRVFFDIHIFLVHWLPDSELLRDRHCHLRMNGLNNVSQLFIARIRRSLSGARSMSLDDCSVDIDALGDIADSLFDDLVGPETLDMNPCEAFGILDAESEDVSHAGQ